jgi:hypothetical protein
LRKNWLSNRSAALIGGSDRNSSAKNNRLKGRFFTKNLLKGKSVVGSGNLRLDFEALWRKVGKDCTPGRCSGVQKHRPTRTNLAGRQHFLSFWRNLSARGVLSYERQIPPKRQT